MGRHTHVAFVSCLLARDSSLTDVIKAVGSCARTDSKNQAYRRRDVNVLDAFHRGSRLSAPPTFEGHVPETHGHGASSEHGEQSEVEHEAAPSGGIWSAASFHRLLLFAAIDARGFQPRAAWGDTRVTLTATEARTSVWR